MQTVVETPSYLAQTLALKLSDGAREAIVAHFAAHPDDGEIMPGTGGARKARIGGRGKGKSGGYRVITFYAADDVPVFLLDIYSKGDKANLSKAERNMIREYLDGLADDYRDSVKKKIASIKRVERSDLNE